MHKFAKSLEIQQRFSLYENEVKERNAKKHITALSAFRMVYWLLKKEVAIRKYESLNDMVSEIGDDPAKLKALAIQASDL